MSIARISGQEVEHVSLENIHITFPGGGTAEEAARAEIPERETAYPEHTMFGILPAYGLWVRRAQGLTLRNVTFELATADARPALVCEDVEDLEVNGFKAAVGEPLIRLRQVRSALVQGCRPGGSVETFVRIEGDRSTNIGLLTNDLRRAHRPVAKADGFSGSVVEAGNLPAQPP